MALAHRIAAVARGVKQFIINNKVTLPVILVVISAMTAATAAEFQHRLQEQSAERIHTFFDRTYGFKVSYDGTLRFNPWNDNGFSFLDPIDQEISIGVYDGDMNNFINSRIATLGPYVLQEQRAFAHISGTMLSSQKGTDYVEKAFYFTQNGHNFGVDIGFYVTTNGAEWYEVRKVLDSFEFVTS